MADIPHKAIIEAVSELLGELEKESGRPLSLAVMNAHRELLHFTRMDGAPYRSSVLGHNKAYSALWFGRDSVEIPKAVGERGITAYGDPRLTLIGGGVLIKGNQGEVLGAVGASGRTMQEDIDAAVRLVDKIKAKAPSRNIGGATRT